MSSSITTRRLRRSALAVALGLCVTSGAVFAQSNTTGTIFGQAAPGSTIVVQSKDTGQTRETQVGNDGRYSITSVAVGNYTVSMKQDGQTVSTQDNVIVSVSRGSAVSFTGAASESAQTLEGVQVVASALPAIDVSQVDTRTVLTAEQLQRIPVARNITAAALLAPGSIPSDSRYGNNVSFGGSAASENAYYINGYAVTNPLTNLGYTSLPFDAIDQLQTITGGYGAEFGRSTGGVVNIITKRGTNQWKAGAQVSWVPESLYASRRNIYYKNNGTAKDGQLFQYRNAIGNWQSQYGAYISGPLIKDKLFVYATGEFTRQEGSGMRPETSVSVLGQPAYEEYTDKSPRWLAKVDWNITDNHIVELTGISDKTSEDYGYYTFDYDTLQRTGTEKLSPGHTKNGGETYIGKYTGYITDNLTVTALYGTQKQVHYQGLPGYDPNLIPISDHRDNPMTCPPGGTPGASSCFVKSQQLYTQINDPDAHDKTDGWRLDVEYQLGDHHLRIGYDTQNLESQTATLTAGPTGYTWAYYDDCAPGSNAQNDDHFPCPANGNPEYVSQNYFANGGSFKVEQEAQYIEDRWQVNDRWLLTMGLRNEQFTNYNADGKPYVRQRHQLAPRIGASWDVHGDSTLKIFANVGRYHLSLPNNVAVRGAAGSTYYNGIYTFTGIDANGIPQGLNPVYDYSNPQVCGGVDETPHSSANCEYGQAPDPRTVAAIDIKSHYQDEYILGMEQQVTPELNFGAKVMFRVLRSAIDDTCNEEVGCFLYNPGRANDFWVQQADGSFEKVHQTNDELTRYPLKRRYASLDMFLEHPFDGHWYGKLEYTFSRNYGNTEGQLLSDIGQSDVSQTQVWDDWHLMEGANGPLPNDRTHQIKAFGYWQPNAQWQFGTNVLIESGRPKNCWGFYGPDQTDPVQYRDSYWWCNGQFTPRGSQGREPWQYRMDLSVAYLPSWAEGLKVQLDVFNIFNQQRELTQFTQYNGWPNTDNPTWTGSPPPVSPSWNRAISYGDPRYFRITARYDFTL